MATYSSTRVVFHKAEEMFALVADLRRYPQFVPLCEKLTVLDSTSDGEREIVTAVMNVRYRFLQESFKSTVVLDRRNLTIRAESRDWPFSTLVNEWKFEPIRDAESQVSFSIDYTFRSRALSAIMSAVPFDRAFRKFADAFERRADEVYGVGR